MVATVALYFSVCATVCHLFVCAQCPSSPSPSSPSPSPPRDPACAREPASLFSVFSVPVMMSAALFFLCVSFAQTLIFLCPTLLCVTLSHSICDPHTLRPVTQFVSFLVPRGRPVPRPGRPVLLPHLVSFVHLLLVFQNCSLRWPLSSSPGRWAMVVVAGDGGGVRVACHRPRTAAASSPPQWRPGREPCKAYPRNYFPVLHFYVSELYRSVRIQLLTGERCSTMRLPSMDTHRAVFCGGGGRAAATAAPVARRARQRRRPTERRGPARHATPKKNEGKSNEEREKGTTKMKRGGRTQTTCRQWTDAAVDGVGGQRGNKTSASDAASHASRGAPSAGRTEIKGEVHTYHTHKHTHTNRPRGLSTERRVHWSRHTAAA